ncbi:MAG: DUF2239 family protein [Longimicrobiales bacterium]
MTDRPEPRFTAFAGPRRLTTGSLGEAAVAARNALAEEVREPILVFDDATGRVVDVDLRGTDEDVRLRAEAQEVPRPALDAVDPAPAPEQRARGRPRLGVVAKEVTLLPRHWAWLAAQRGGASATLRRLVDEARRNSGRRDQVRRAQDAAYRFMLTTGGDLPGYEEATRALFAGDAIRFETHTAAWPPDLREHGRRLAADALGGGQDA